MGTYEEAGRPSLDVIIDRQRGMSRTIGDLLKWRNGGNGQLGADTRMSLMEERQETLERKVDALIQSVDALRKVILGFAISIAVASVGVMLSLLISTGKL